MSDFEQAAAMNAVERSIRQTRTIRVAAVLAIALNALIFVGDLALGSPLVFVPPLTIASLLVLIVWQTRRIGTLRARERELNRPRMTPEDYRHLREMEIELGWEPSGPACDCGECDDAAREFDRQVREQIIASQGIPPAQLMSPAVTCACPPDARAPVGVRTYVSGSPVIRYCSACGKRIREDGAAWDDVAYASEASEHFAQLARVGRESCISYCHICADRSE